jgi:thymidylate kinase
MIKKETLFFRKKISQYFVNFMNQQNIKYLFLGDISYFPSKITSDLDFYIDFNRYNDLKKIFKKFTRKFNLEISNIIRHEYNSYYIILSKKIKKNYYFIAFDVCNSYVIKSRKVLDLKNSEKKLVKQKNIKYFVPSNNYLFFYYLIKKINKNDINIKSFTFLKKIFFTLKEKDFIKFINNNNYRELAKVFASNNIKIFKKKRSKLKDNLIKQHRRNYLNEFKRIFSRLKFKTGAHIAILGIDGSGKSTQINHLKKSNFVQLFREVYIQHLFTANIAKKHTEIPYTKNNYGYTLSLIKIFYLYISFIINFLFIVYPKKIKSTLVINDRNHQDVIIDPYRYRIGKFHKLLQFIFKFLPDADLTIYLDLNTKKLISRKNELSLKKVIELSKNYNNLILNCKYTKIKSDKKINLVNFEIKNNILRLMNNKTLKIN